MDRYVAELIVLIARLDQEAAGLRRQLERRTEQAVAKPTGRRVGRVSRLRRDLADSIRAIRFNERQLRRLQAMG